MSSSRARAAADGCCPVPNCKKKCSRWAHLLIHWKSTHEVEHGEIHEYLDSLEGDACGHGVGSSEDVGDQHGPDNDGFDSDEEAVVEEDDQVDHVLRAAMSHIDEMKFRFYQTDAQTNRAKLFARDLIRDCVGPAVTKCITQFIAEHPDEHVDVPQLIKPILCALDRISSEKTERAYRCACVRLHVAHIVDSWLLFCCLDQTCSMQYHKEPRAHQSRRKELRRRGGLKEIKVYPRVISTFAPDRWRVRRRLVGLQQEMELRTRSSFGRQDLKRC